MTGDDDMKLEGAIIDAWSDVKVDDRLKAATLKAVHEAALEPQASKVVARIEPQADNGKSSGADSSPIPSRHKSKVFRSRGFVAGLIAAVLCLAVVGIGGNAIYHTETAYASISAKASVTLGVNRFGNVINASAGDPQLQDEIDALGLSGRTYADAISALVASGYLGSTEVDITVSADADAQENELVNTSTESLEEAGCSGTCNGNGYGHRYRGGRDAGSSSSEGSEQTCADASADTCSESGGETCDGENCTGETCDGENCNGKNCTGNGNGAGKGTGAGNGNGARMGRASFLGI